VAPTYWKCDPKTMEPFFRSIGYSGLVDADDPWWKTQYRNLQTINKDIDESARVCNGLEENRICCTNEMFSAIHDDVMQEGPIHANCEKKTEKL
jgi:hypothetical protein